MIAISLLALGCEAAPEPADDAGAPEPAVATHRYEIDASKKVVGYRKAPEQLYQKEYQFSEDWFTGNIPMWMAALEDLAGQPNLRYLEVGCFEGRSALWMLENILTDETSRMTCIDPYAWETNAKSVLLENVRRSGAEGRFELMAEYSQVAMRRLPLESFDVIYIDGDHRAPQVMEDAVLAWRLLKDGGIVIFDDYKWEPGYEPIDLPLMAVDFFIETFANQLEVVHHDYQVMLRKLPSQE